MKADEGIDRMETHEGMAAPLLIMPVIKREEQ